MLSLHNKSWEARFAVSKVVWSTDSWLRTSGDNSQGHHTGLCDLGFIA